MGRPPPCQEKLPWGKRGGVSGGGGGGSGAIMDRLTVQGGESTGGPPPDGGGGGGGGGLNWDVFLRYFRLQVSVRVRQLGYVSPCTYPWRPPPSYTKNNKGSRTKPALGPPPSPPVPSSSFAATAHPPRVAAPLGRPCPPPPLPPPLTQTLKTALSCY